MKNLILVATVTLAAAYANADVFADYQKAGAEALALAQNPNTPKETVVAKIQELVTYGYQIMDLHQVKYAECTVQYSQVKAADAKMLDLTYEEIDEQYHAGLGLVAAPRICYKGRSLVVHPYQIAALAQAGKLQTNADDVDHELNEVIDRSAVIKKDLGL